MFSFKGIALFVCSFYADFNLSVGHILAVSQPNQLSWLTYQLLPISPQVTDYLTHDFWISGERQITICPRSIKALQLGS